MQSFGMNTYLYAPKDDYKHRLDWRELYSPEETGTILKLSFASLLFTTLHNSDLITIFKDFIEDTKGW